MAYETAKEITVISQDATVFVTNRVKISQKSQLIELILKQQQDTGLPTHAAVTWADDSVSFVHGDSDNLDANGICWDDYL